MVLLHDSGGDRSATVEALPALIHALRAKGFEFKLASEMGGLTRDQAMPLVSPGQSVYTRADAVAFLVLMYGGWLMQWTFHRHRPGPGTFDRDWRSGFRPVV
jgi:hypothetical protein